MNVCKNSRRELRWVGCCTRIFMWYLVPCNQRALTAQDATDSGQQFHGLQTAAYLNALSMSLDS
jgi:hypothetical protein